MTNYEQIKDMSLRNLAIKLSDFVTIETCPFRHNDKLICESTCDYCFEKWLNEEVEE